MKGPTNSASAVLFYLSFPLLLFIWWTGFVFFLITFLLLGGLLRILRLLPKRIPSIIPDRDFLVEIQDHALGEACPRCTWEHFHFKYKDLNIHSLHLALGDTGEANPAEGLEASLARTSAFIDSQVTVADAAQQKGAKKPDLLLIHGTGSSSAAWTPIMERLAETFNIHAIDLPGFGRSDGPTSLRRSSREETIDFYCDFLRTYLHEAGLGQVVLVAHSYGCYIASHFASRNTHLVSKLFLACPAGTLSTQSHQGAWLAPIFTSTTPQATAQLLGMFGRAGLFLYFDMKRCPDFVETYYRWELWLRSSAHHTLKHFVRRELIYSSWTKPVLPLLLQLPMPIALFYGELDRIIPPHNGPAIVQLADSDVPCYIIEGADHSPFRGEGGHVKFVSAVVDAHMCSAVPFGAKAAVLGASLDVKVLQKYKTSYNLAWSLIEIQRQYKMLADLAADAGIIPGRVIFVSEEIIPVSSLSKPPSQLLSAEEAVSVSSVALITPPVSLKCTLTAAGLSQHAKSQSTLESAESAMFKYGESSALDPAEPPRVQLSIIAAAAAAVGKGAEILLQKVKSRESSSSQHVVTIILSGNELPLMDRVSSCNVEGLGGRGKGKKTLESVV